MQKKKKLLNLLYLEMETQIKFPHCLTFPSNRSAHTDRGEDFAH